MIIDCHGHYTTAPPQLGDYRDAQQALPRDRIPTPSARRVSISISDDEIRDSLEGAQLKLQRERGTDLTIFSPRASWMGHHIGNAHTSRFWSEHCNELIRRVCDLYPANFAPVCQLPQSPGAPIDSSVRELRRCVDEMGFIGCNLNPDPSGGYWTGPPLDDRSFWPLYEAMCELDVPAMIHVSDTCNPNFHTTGSHYLGADTTAFMQVLTSGMFKDFPTLRFIIPHGGGAVPYHWGRFRGIAQDTGLADARRADGATSGSTRASTTSRASTCSSTWCRSTTSCSRRRWSARCGASIRRPATTTTTPGATSTAPISPTPTAQKIFEGNVRRVFPRLRTDATGGAQ